MRSCILVRVLFFYSETLAARGRRQLPNLVNIACLFLDRLSILSCTCRFRRRNSRLNSYQIGIKSQVIQ